MCKLVIEAPQKLYSHHNWQQGRRACLHARKDPANPNPHGEHVPGLRSLTRQGLPA